MSSNSWGLDPCDELDGRRRLHDERAAAPGGPLAAKHEPSTFVGEEPQPVRRDTIGRRPLSQHERERQRFLSAMTKSTGHAYGCPFDRGNGRSPCAHSACDSAWPTSADSAWPSPSSSCKTKIKDYCLIASHYESDMECAAADRATPARPPPTLAAPLPAPNAPPRCALVCPAGVPSGRRSG